MPEGKVWYRGGKCRLLGLLEGALIEGLLEGALIEGALIEGALIEGARED